MKQLFHIAIVLSLPFLAIRCTEDEATPAIRIVSPAGGASFKLNDTVNVITECDYGQFTSGITFNVSIDSAKSWEFIKSLVRKEGIQKDTLKWVVGEDSPQITAGSRAVIQAIDYTKKFPTKSGFISFTN